MQLGNNHTLGTINNKGTVFGHIGNGAKEYILDECTEILMFRVGAVEFHLGL